MEGRRHWVRRCTGGALVGVPRWGTVVRAGYFFFNALNRAVTAALTSCSDGFAVATDVAVYVCDPKSPWPRGTNENTNGLLRQYLPDGTDLSVYTQRAFDRIARELNTRPRKTLGFRTPAVILAEGVAPTG